MINLILKGRPITKKNSQRIVVAKNGRRFVIQSKQYLTYEKDCLWQIKEQLTIIGLQRRVPKPVLFPIIGSISLQAHYYMPTKRIPDLINLLQATCDILEKARVIENDKNIISFDGSRIMGVDKVNPRCEIIIRGIPKPSKNFTEKVMEKINKKGGK